MKSFASENAASISFSFAIVFLLAFVYPFMNAKRYAAGWDPTNGCVYYFNPDTATNSWIWSKTIVKTIGKHHFCK